MWEFPSASSRLQSCSIQSPVNINEYITLKSLKRSMVWVLHVRLHKCWVKLFQHTYSLQYFLLINMSILFLIIYIYIFKLNYNWDMSTVPVWLWRRISIFGGCRGSHVICVLHAGIRCDPFAFVATVMALVQLRWMLISPTVITCWLFWRHVLFQEGLVQGTAFPWIPFQ